MAYGKERGSDMRYHVAASGQMGVVSLKRDTIAGALKKAREFREEGLYSEVRVFEDETGLPVDEDRGVSGRDGGKPDSA